MSMRLHRLRNAQLFSIPWYMDNLFGRAKRKFRNSKRLRLGTPGAFGKCHYKLDYSLPDMASRGPRPNSFYKASRA